MSTAEIAKDALPQGLDALCILADQQRRKVIAHQ
jgi:hypothetical protein